MDVEDTALGGTLKNKAQWQKSEVMVITQRLKDLYHKNTYLTEVISIKDLKYQLIIAIQFIKSPAEVYWTICSFNLPVVLTGIPKAAGYL